MQGRCFQRDQHRDDAIAPESHDAATARRSRKKTSKPASQADGVQPPSGRWRQRTLFDLDGDDASSLPRKVEPRPARRPRKKASKVDPGQMFFEWFEPIGQAPDGDDA